MHIPLLYKGTTKQVMDPLGLAVSRMFCEWQAQLPWSIVLKGTQHQALLCPFNTVYHAELSVIWKGVEWLASNNFTKATMYTDSQASVRALTYKFSRSTLVKRAIRTSQENRLRLFLSSFKGQAGIEEDEKEVSLAKETQRLSLVYEDIHQRRKWSAGSAKKF